MWLLSNLIFYFIHISHLFDSDRLISSVSFLPKRCEISSTLFWEDPSQNQHPRITHVQLPHIRLATHCIMVWTIKLEFEIAFRPEIYDSRPICNYIRYFQCWNSDTVVLAIKQMVHGTELAGLLGDHKITSTRHFKWWTQTNEIYVRGCSPVPTLLCFLRPY